MAGRSPAEALHAFVAPIRRAFDCVTRDVPQHQGAELEGAGLLTIADGGPLEFAGTDATLTFQHRYRVVRTDDPERGPWKIATAAYLYTIDDQDGELLGYHWHPVGHHADPRPHLHIRTDDNTRVRLPAGRVAIEEVIRLLIEEFGVEPLRSDWRDVLGGAQSVFEEWQTWGSGAPPK